MNDDPAAQRLAQSYEHCGALVRRADPDRWFSSLFAPTAMRQHLHALYAFSAEIAQIRDIVSDPTPGEIRLQWWREAIEGEPRGDVAAHPVAAALLATRARFGLPRGPLTDLIDARTFDLYDDPMPGLRQLEGYCGETSSVLFRLASLILRDGREPGGAVAAGHGGVAYAIVGLLRALPWRVGQGRDFVPSEVLANHGASRAELREGRATPGVLAALAELRDHARARLAKATPILASVHEDARPAFLPLALIDPYLAQMERRGYDPFATRIDLPLARRQWRLWRAARQWPKA